MRRLHFSSGSHLRSFSPRKISILLLTISEEQDGPSIADLNIPSIRDNLSTSSCFFLRPAGDVPRARNKAFKSSILWALYFSSSCARRSRELGLAIPRRRESGSEYSEKANDDRSIFSGYNKWKPEIFDRYKEASIVLFHNWTRLAACDDSGNQSLCCRVSSCA